MQKISTKSDRKLSEMFQTNLQHRIHQELQLFQQVKSNPCKTVFKIILQKH